MDFTGETATDAVVESFQETKDQQLRQHVLLLGCAGLLT